jgi:hypothetical protein
MKEQHQMKLCPFRIWATVELCPEELVRVGTLNFGTLELELRG